MAKYLVTSGSYFEPFTYDQIAAPVREAAEMHRATQDAYDQYNMEAEALRHYLDAEPDDSEARRMYEGYMSKLQTLQNNLWANGYNTQTRRDLAAARAGYAGDITRLGAAIQMRQKRSEEWGAYKREHPDAITSEDPGLASLDEYLKNDRYGSDYFTTSGNQLAQDIASDLKARGQELLSNPELMNMNLPGYYFLQTNNGFTNEQVNTAMAAVRDYWNGAGESAFDSLDPITKVAADAIRYHLDKTGASSRVTAKEFEKALDFAAYGASQGVGKPSVEHLENKQWDYGMRNWLAEQEDNRSFNNWYRQQVIQHPEWFDENGNRIITPAEGDNFDEFGVSSHQYYNGTGESESKTIEALRKLFGDISKDNPLIIKTEDGTKEITDWATAYSTIFNGRYASAIQQKYGFNPNIFPSNESLRQRRIVEATDSNGNQVRMEISTDKLTDDERRELNKGRDVKLGKDAVAIRRVVNGREILDKDMTENYNALLRFHKENIDEIIKLNDNRALKNISPDKLVKYMTKNGIDLNVPPKYVESAVRLRSMLGTVGVPSLVSPGDDAKVKKKYAGELYATALSNNITTNSPFAIYRVNKDGTIDYKKPITDIRDVLDVKENGGLDDNDTGGLQKIEAMPTDIYSGKSDDIHGRLRVTTNKGTFLVNPRMFNSIVADNVTFQRLQGLPDLMEPFLNPDKIFTESYSNSRDRLEESLYELTNKVPNLDFGDNMASFMNDEQNSMWYYDLINNYIQSAFNRIKE